MDIIMEWCPHPSTWVGEVLVTQARRGCLSRSSLSPSRDAPSHVSSALLSRTTLRKERWGLITLTSTAAVLGVRLLIVKYHIE